MRQSIVPAEDALKMPASVIAPVPVPAGKVAVAVTWLEDDEKEANVLLWNSQVHNLMHIIGS